MSILSTPKAPKGYDMFQFPTRGGQSADLYNKVMNSGLYEKLLSMGQGSPEAFQGQEQHALNQFNQQIAPQIAQRYAGSGIGSSSGMQNAIAGAGGNLAAQLKSERGDIMHRSIQDLLGLGNLLLSNPDYETQFMPKKKSSDWWQKSLGVALPVGGAALGGIFGGPTGAYLGGQVGSAAGQAFL